MDPARKHRLRYLDTQLKLLGTVAGVYARRPPSQAEARAFELLYQQTAKIMAELADDYEASGDLVTAEKIRQRLAVRPPLPSEVKH